MPKRCDEELSSYLNPLLTIGTFGGNLKDSCKGHLQNTTNSEEPGEGNKVLDRLLPNHHTTIDLTSSFKSEKQRSSSMKKSLDTLPEEEKIANNFLSENKAVHLRRTTNGKNGMYKQSFSFLLERQLLYRNGFLPSPVLEDSLPDPKVDKSRMKKVCMCLYPYKAFAYRMSWLHVFDIRCPCFKISPVAMFCLQILKAMLGKKKYHRRQKYLDTVETQEGEANWGYWVKTDSECKHNKLHRCFSSHCSATKTRLTESQFTHVDGFANILLLIADIVLELWSSAPSIKESR